MTRARYNRAVNVRHDFGHSWRSLRRAPSLTIVSILTVALGVAAATTFFSVMKAVLLNPLPYPEPDRLTWVEAINDGVASRTSLPDFDDWRAESRGFAALAAYSEAPVVAGGGLVPERLAGAIVTEDFFAVMGVRPVIGRDFSPDEHRGAPLSTVILGHGLWQRLYGGDAGILGRRVTVLGRPSTVVGVMPAGFAFPAGSELWVSARALNDGNVRTAHNYWVVGRRSASSPVEAAALEVSAIARRLKQQYPGAYQTEDATARLLQTHLVGSVRAPLLMLFGAVGMLLLVVCVNVANLLLVRVTGRARELAVRTAMGAERRDLVRQLLIESLLLATAGAVVGVLLAFWSMDFVRVILPAGLPRAADVRIDAGVIMFAIGLSAAAGVLFGTLPAWRASLLNVYEVLKGGARGQTASPRVRRTQSALVVSEVALSLMLLAGAGLLLDSFTRLRAVDPGFRPDGVLSVDLSFPMTNRVEVGRLLERYRDLLQQVRQLPGVEAAGTIKDLPLDPVQRSGHFFIENRPNAPVSDAGYLVVTPGLKEALGLSLVSGRWLDESDSETAPGAVVISEEMARRFWRDRDPIGARVWFNSFEPKEHWLTIVGVARDVRQSGLTAPAPAQAYVSYAQAQIRAQLGTGNLLIRSSVDPQSLVPSVRKAISAVSPEAAATFRTLDEVMSKATARQRFQMQVLGAFAVMALMLAAIGLYGILSYTVTAGRAAIGIRMALGAQRVDVFRLVASRALGLTAAGAALGLAGCVLLRSVLETVVFGVGPSDPRVLTLAVGVMLATAMAACWFPARRAMRVDPIAALREE